MEQSAVPVPSLHGPMRHLARGGGGGSLMCKGGSGLRGWPASVHEVVRGQRHFQFFRGYLPSNRCILQVLDLWPPVV